MLQGLTADAPWLADFVARLLSRGNGAPLCIADKFVRPPMFFPGHNRIGHMTRHWLLQDLQIKYRSGIMTSRGCYGWGMIIILWMFSLREAVFANPGPSSEASQARALGGSHLRLPYPRQWPDNRGLRPEPYLRLLRSCL